jgi:multidrug efflux pump subunit AcrA (membrane-fusion protein)
MYQSPCRQRDIRLYIIVKRPHITHHTGISMFKEILHNRWFWPALIGLLVLIWLLGSHSEESAGNEPVWSDLRRGDFTIDGFETGEVEAVHSVDLAPPMEWRMDMQIIAMVPEGTVVKAGDFLVQFDTSDLQDRLELAQDGLSSLLAQRDGLRAEQSARISQLKANIAAAGYSEEVAALQRELLKYEAEVARMDAELQEKKAQITLEEAKTNLESQEIIDTSALSTLGVEISKSRADVRELEEKIKNLTLRAPIDGLVVYNEIGFGEDRKKIAIGDKPRPGESVISIPNLDSMQVKLRVNEMDAARLAADQTAAIKLDAYPDRSFTGRVTKIAKLAQQEDWDSEIKDFEVIVRMDQADSVLKPGMTAKVQIALGVEKEVLSAPTGSVFERNGERVIFPKKSYPKPLKIETGVRDDHRIVIKTELAQAGDLISCIPPDTSYHRMGYTRYASSLKGRSERLAEAFAEMDKRGLNYDYDGNRGRWVIARAPNGATGDIEKLRGIFQAGSPDGRPVEIDPARMKQLQEAMRGMQAAPGGMPGMAGSRQRGEGFSRGFAPGDTSMRRVRREGGQGFPPGFAPGDTTRRRFMRERGEGFPPGFAPGDTTRRRFMRERGEGFPPGFAPGDTTRRR